MNENQYNNTQFEPQDLGNGFYGDSGVERVSGKSKGAKIAAVSGISAAVLIGGCGAAYAFSDFVKNQVKLRISSPESYYAWVYENNAKEIAKNMSDNYAESLKNYEKGSSVDMTLSYNIPTALRNELMPSVEGTEYESIVKDMKSVAFDVNYAVNKGDISYDFGLDYNDSRLVTAEAFMQNTGSYLFRIPELKDRWISFDAASEMDEEVLGVYSKIMSDPGAYLSAADVENEVNKYIGLWADMTKDVKVEKSEELDICDIKVKYTVAQVDVTPQLCKDFIVKAADELENDSVIKKLLTDSTGSMTEDEYAEGIKSLRESAESITGESDETVAFRTYIDPKGVIRGFEIETPDGMKVNALLGKEDTKIRGEFNFSGEGEDTAKAVLKADEVSKDTYDGELKITVEDTEFSVSFDDLKVVDKVKGYSEGTVNVNFKEETIKIDLTSDGNSQKMSYDLNVEGKNYGQLELSYSVNDSADVKVPDKSGSFEISEDMEDASIEDYVAEEDAAAFVSGLLQKIGFSKDDADEVAEMYIPMLYGGGYDDYEYDFDEDDLYRFDVDEEFSYDEDEDEDYDFSFDNENLNKVYDALYDLDYENMTDEDFDNYLKFCESLEKYDMENLTDAELEEILAEIEKLK